MLKNNNFREKLDQAIANLKAKISIEVNEEFFKEKAPEADHAGHDHATNPQAAKQANPAVGA